MMKTTKLAVCLALMPGAAASAAPAPEATISNNLVRVHMYLPDATNGFYRGTRFDWSGVIGALEYAGHNYYPQWFQRMDPAVHDFIYDGDRIVAGPCTAVTGPAEEFVTPLGFDQATAGQTFIKVGIGVLRRPDTAAYDNYRLYEIADAGKWTVRPTADSVEFTQELTDPSTGYSYSYRKTVSLAKDQPRLMIDHSLRNTGTQPIRTSVYNHNFLFLDQQPPGPGVTITVPFNIRATPAPNQALAEVRGNQIVFVKPLAGKASIYMTIQGFGDTPKDYDVRIENRKAGAGLRITADRALSRAALWSIRAPLSFEPFIDISIEPDSEFTWRLTYDHYTLDRD